MGYLIRLHEVGKPPRLIQVVDDNGFYRDAYFDTIEDARKWQAVIERMRTDSAFLNTELVEEAR